MEPLFESLVQRARFFLAVERVWPFVLGPFLIGGAFLALSFSGFWLVVPALVRAIGLFLFALALAYDVLRLLRLRVPTRAEAVRRLDHDSDLPHPLVAAFDDRPVAGSDLTIWAEHRRRLVRALHSIRLNAPRSDMARRDPFALRAVVVLALVTTALMASHERELRVRAAFDFMSQAQAQVIARLDGWIVPPGYTHRAPVLFLNQKVDSHATDFAVPAGSQVHVRGAGLATLDLDASEGLEALPGSVTERNFLLGSDAQLKVGGGRQFVFQAIADLPPMIVLRGAPKPQGQGRLLLQYKTDDDYGVVSAQARFSAHADAADRRALVPPPQVDLVLPPVNGLGDGETTLDLADHPWAGAKVRLVLAARDEGGHETLSPPVELVLPEHAFHNPLAHALMEQRRILVLEPDSRRDEVLLALDGLTIAPENFPVSASAYLGVRTAALRLRKAQNDSDLLDVAQILHDVAMSLEEQSHTPAEQQLKAAQQALREAMKNGASPEEIAKLMQNLREALANVLREAMLRPHASSSSRSSQTITPEDMKSLMDRLNDAAKSGNLPELEALLQQLDAMTSNLQADDGKAQTSPLDDALNNLDSLMQDQQDLRDKTYQQGASPKSPSAREALQQGQSDLRRKLQDLNKQMKDSGMEGDPALNSAEQAMKQAETALGEQGKNSGNAAVYAQGKALENLRRGVESLAQKAEKAGGKDSNGRQSAKGQDPLGRDDTSRGSKFDRTRRAGALNADPAQRVQQIFREIQRRAAEGHRSPVERDYLDRLLQNF